MCNEINVLVWVNILICMAFFGNKNYKNFDGFKPSVFVIIKLGKVHFKSLIINSF